MDASRILEALMQHHTARSSYLADRFAPSTKSFLNNDQGISCSDVSGEYMATLFAHAASKELEYQESCELLTFLLKKPVSLSSTQHKQLIGEIDRRLHDFYAAETSISGQDKSRLCVPSGKEDAELMIILHCQTKGLLLPTGNFWDMTSFTIQLLASKGYSTKFLYGYDWHWRAEETCIGRGKCSASKWPQALKNLHDRFSFSLFTILPSRFALIGGICAREHIRRILNSSAAVIRRTLSLSIDLTTGLQVECDLIFQNKTLIRIIIYIYHPSAIYFESQKESKPCALQVEAASNLILWLLGQAHNPVSIQKLVGKGSRYHRYAAPLSDIHHYIALEKQLNRILDQTEYLNEFLDWTKRFLGGDYDTIVQKKSSIAGACAEIMNERAWTARIQNYIVKQQSDRNQGGTDSAERYPNARGMYSQSLGESEQGSKTKPLDDNQILGTREVLRGSPEELSMSKFRYMQAQINRSVAFNRILNYHRELWDGHQVTLFSGGTLAIWVPWREKALKCFVSRQASARVRKAQRDPTIHFLPEKVILKIEGEIVFSRSNTFLLHGQCGEGWKKQIEIEHRAKGYATPSAELNSCSLSGSDEKDVRMNSRAGWNADRRKQLLEGTDLHCGERKNDKYGRATLRGQLYILVPRDADFSWVWVQCDLLDKGHDHPESCATSAHDGDPAKRLGIRLRYKSKEGGETIESWYKWKTDCDTKKINTLVDYLDGESEGYTEKQSRRFLPKKKEKGKDVRSETYT